MRTNTTTTLKSLAVFALAVACIPALAQSKEKPAKKVEKRIEIDASSEDGNNKVTITTTENGKETVEVIEGAEANVWMEENESGKVIESGDGQMRVFVTVDEENGEQVKHVKVISSDGANEEVRMVVTDGDDASVWVSDRESTEEPLSFKQDPTSGIYKLILNLEEAQEGILYVKNADDKEIFSEKITTDGKHEFQVKVENKGEMTVGFKSEEMVIVKKLLIE